MGNLFSGPKATAPSAEQQARLDALRKVTKEKQAAIAQADHDVKQLLVSQFERQKRIAKERIKEIEAMIKRAKELRDARKALNIQSAVLLCAIYHNYPFGRFAAESMDTDKDVQGDTSWASNAETIVNVALNEKVFWILVRLPQLMPLLWPTGDTEIERKFHEYTQRDAKSVPIPTKYEIDINTHIGAYIKEVLPKRITDLFQSNNRRSLTNDTDAKKDMDQDCAALIASVEMVQNDDELLYRLAQFIKFDDPMNYKCFAARAGKGICSKPILLLPETFPKRCPRYELYEAILMTVNTVINQFGECQFATGDPVPTKVSKQGSKKVDKQYKYLTVEEKKQLDPNVKYKDEDTVTITESDIVVDVNIEGTTNGGKCFALEKKWTDNCYKHAIGNYADEKKFWDGKKYIPASEIVIDDELITGEKDHKKWMLLTSIHNVKEAYYKNTADEANMSGFVRWQNPTRRFTYQFLNDMDKVKFTFKMPLLNADMNEIMRRMFLFNAYNILTTGNEDSESAKYDVYRCVNKELLYSMDYLIVTPPALTKRIVTDGCSALSRFIYTLLVENSCQWHMMFPISDIMTMGRINYSILNDEAAKKLTRPDGTPKDPKESLPQNIWTRTPNFKYPTDVSKTLSALPAIPQIECNNLFGAGNIIDLQNMINARNDIERDYNTAVNNRSVATPLAAQTWKTNNFNPKFAINSAANNLKFADPIKDSSAINADRVVNNEIQMKKDAEYAEKAKVVGSPEWKEVRGKIAKADPNFATCKANRGTLGGKGFLKSLPNPKCVQYTKDDYDLL